MSVELLALSAAFFYACGQVSVKYGTQGQGMVTGFLVSLVTGVLVLGAYTLVMVESWSIAWAAVGFFVAAGVAGPGLGRLLSMRSIRDAGASVGSPIQSSTNPLLSSLAGVLLFGEVIDARRGLALTLIVLGIFVCARGGSANRSTTLLPGGRSRWVLLWPVGAGAAFAAADLLRKLALNLDGDPLLGALIGVSTALVLWTIVTLASPRLRSSLTLSRHHGWFVVYGLMSAVGLAALLTALRDGDLSVVIPIFSSMPVIVIILGAFLLRRFEVLRVGTVVGAVIVFVGVATLALA